MMTDDSLESWVRAALAGDKAALEPLCSALQGPVYRLAVRMLGDPDDAKDATQDVLVKVITHLAQFRGESSVTTWAYAIAVRHLLRMRSKRSNTMSHLSQRIEAGLAATADWSGQLSSGERAVETRETHMGCTQAMLVCLTPDERMTVILSELLGADDELGARLCEISATTYRKRLSRARAKLAPVLERLCGLADDANPCRCARQSEAKVRAGMRTEAWSRLPIVADDVLARARDRLGEVRALGAVFAHPGMLAPPDAIWSEIRSRLAAVLAF